MESEKFNRLNLIKLQFIWRLFSFLRTDLVRKQNSERFQDKRINFFSKIYFILLLDITI